jgi:formylglycine-generating enzyme required for sulfatase activity
MAKYFTICFLFIAAISFGNNLQISPVTLSTSGGSSYLNFSISWENSWRVSSNSNNWDAVWVFFKRRDCAAIQWHHVNLTDQDADHTATAPLFVDAYSDKKGVMIYRLTNGFGNISNANIQIKLDAPPAGNYEYKVFGTEMVYVNQGGFFAGDGTSYATLKTAATQNPYHVTSEGAISISSNGSDLFAGNLNQGTIIPASFPKGFNAFYCMKYEISQGQYTDFLNSIAQDAIINRYEPTYVNTNRYTISGTWPAFTASANDRACNFIGFKDLLAFLDWSALSPMTELEFEKVCRGSDINSPLARELAWGGITATDADSIVTGTNGTAGEIIGTPIGIGTGLANYGNDSILGPLRSGFAAKVSTNRFQAGGSYYGIMELSGNVYEMCYSVNNYPATSQGFNFTGSHGDGELNTTPSPGFANQNWPAELGTDAIEYASVILKGGSWFSPNSYAELAISDRTLFVLSILVPLEPFTGRNNSIGGRGVSRR